MSMTPLNDLLRSPADEVEESPDKTMPPEPPLAQAGPAQSPDQTPDGADAGEQATTSGTSEPEGQKRMHALPKWAHERMRANDEKAAAAERRVAEIEAQAQADRQRAAQLEQYLQSQGYASQQDQMDPVEAVRMETQNAIYQTRVQLGHDRAVEKHGDDYVKHASEWAADMMQSDSRLAASILQAPDPVGLAITEFRRAQFEREAAQYGYDIDALVRARAGQMQPSQVQTQPAAGVPGASQQKPRPNMPNDFSSGGASASRSTDQWAGPTPLSVLLNQKRP